MSVTFGFDLGTNSIGWAVVDEANQEIKGMGSMVFSMGVNLVKGSKEESLNETRRVKRQLRRQYFRRGIRKAKLAEKLFEKGLFPDIEALYEKYFPEGSETRYPNKFRKLIRQAPLCPELNEFFKIDPYEMRHLAFEGNKLGPHQLGRVFYQMGLRRGYRETLKDGDDKGAIYKGVPKENRTGIDETLEKIEEFGTLGNYLFYQDPHQTRLRNRYTLRSMYTDEFQIIYDNQRKFYPDILDDTFYNELGFTHPSDTTKNGILFFQRPLRSQKHLLGKCRYETNKPIAPKSCLDFEYFRALTYATNIKMDGEALDVNDQKLVVDYLLNQDKPKNFENLRKKLSNPHANFNYDDKEKLPGNPTHATLSKIFGKEWNKMNAKEREDLWHLKYWAEDPEWLEQYLLSKKYELDEKAIVRFKNFRLADGYSNLSRKAIRNITEFLKKGYGNDEAVLLAGVKRALDDKWPESAADQSFIEDNIIAIAKDGSVGPSIDRIKYFLKEEFGVSERSLKKLYHHSFKVRGELSKYLPEPKNVRNPIVQKALFKLRTLYNALVDEFGEPDAVKVELARDLKGSKKERDKIRQMNMDRRATNIELKKILDKYRQPHTRENIQKLQLYNEIKEKNGRATNPFNPEQTFGIEDLFGTGAVQIEHIVPLSRSLNNSLSNKTLCDADTNRAKGNRTPMEYFQAIGADWEAIKNRIFDILPYQKAKRFILESNTDAEDFISRQLNDTRYISRYAVEYLRNACRRVDIMQGTVSALLRHYWGLDGILTPPKILEVENGEYLVAIDKEGEVVDYRKWNAGTLKKDENALAKKGQVFGGNVIHEKFYPRKQRLDHRHHAIDALVVALGKRAHLQQLSTAHANEVAMSDLRSDSRHFVDKPWDRFWVDAKKAVDQILVVHEQNNRVLTKTKKKLYDFKGNPRKKNGNQLYGEGYSARGPLHEETVYGKYFHDGETPYYHVRKSIDFIQTHSHLAKVVDPGVRDAITDRLREVGIDVTNPKGWDISALDNEAKKTVFFEADENGIPQPKVFMPNKNGSPIPVRKVRIKESIGNATRLKNPYNQFVNPKNNHHVLIYHDSDGNLQEEVVNFWTAVKRAADKRPVYRTPKGGDLWFTMEKNDMFILGLPDHHVANWMSLDNDYLSDHLYRVQNISGGYYVFRLHRASSQDFDSEMKRIQSMGKLISENPIKVKLDVLGNLRPW